MPSIYPFPDNTPLKILLSAYTGLGNFVLKTPAISQLKAVLPPKSCIDLIAGNSFGSDYVLKNSPLIGQTHILKPTASIIEKTAFFAQLRPLNYHAILLPFDAQPRFLILGSYIAGISRRIIHHKPSENPRPYPFSIYLPTTHNCHEIDLNLDLFQLICPQKKLARQYNTIVSYIPDHAVLPHFGLIAKQYIILQIGAANGLYKAKVWPPERFATLIRHLANVYGGKIVLVGDRGDFEHSIMPLLPQIAPWADAVVVNTAGQTNFNSLVNLLANAALVVCHDSGIMHLSDALSVPLIALYGPTDSLRTCPLKTSSEVLFSETPYKGIMANFACTEADLLHLGHMPMEGLSVETVFEAIMRRLKG